MKALLPFMLLASANLYGAVPSPGPVTPRPASSGVLLNWTEPSSIPLDITSYGIYRADSCSNAFSQIATVVPTEHSYVDATATAAGQLYCYYVTTKTSTEESGPSNSTAIVVPTGATFSVGDTFRVSTTGGGNLNVRSSPSPTASIVGSLKNNSSWQITGGPATGDNIVFWRMSKGYVQERLIRQ